MTDVCIIGSGVIGLSIARELAGRGLSVRVLAREAGRDTASWAAAGIFPPAPERAGGSPNERLTAWSHRLHAEWAAELRHETGIDNELEACGGLHLARDKREMDRLRDTARDWLAKGARSEIVGPGDLARLEPALGAAARSGRVLGGMLLPDEMTIRPPRHLDALAASCRQRGVRITAASVRQMLVSGGRIEGVVTSGADGGGPEEIVQADRYCLAAGAWSAAIAEPLGLRIETRPIRGQIALLHLPARPLERVINVGLAYLVARGDGRVLVGSTLEDAGFDRETTPGAISRLLDFATWLLGPLPPGALEQSWAGLRPGSVDGLPLVGPVPACTNAFVATGHFRAGLHQSTGTAVMIADLMTGRTPPIDPTAFAPSRVCVPGGPDSVTDYLARAVAEA
jgi:glycine oxidase